MKPSPRFLGVGRMGEDMRLGGPFNSEPTCKKCGEKWKRYHGGSFDWQYKDCPKCAGKEFADEVFSKKETKMTWPERMKQIRERVEKAQADPSLYLRIPTWVTAGDGRDWMYMAYDDIPLLLNRITQLDGALREAWSALINAQEVVPCENAAALIAKIEAVLNGDAECKQ